MKWMKITLVICALTILFLSVERLVEPKYMETLQEGSMTAEYYQEKSPHAVIFIGDCEVYANISPMVLYEEAGITSYVRGNSQQLLWQSYGILKETLRYEIPKVIVFNVNAMRYDKPVSEAYNRLLLDNMKWGEEKVEIIRSSMLEEENFLSYVFPILRYHSRITALTKEDIEYFWKTKKNTHNGFLINKTVKPATSAPRERPLTKDDFSDICYEYLEKMRKLCEENGIEFVLMKAPSLYPYWPQEYEEAIEQYAKIHHLDYYNFKEKVEEIGLDYQTDTYDGGYHLNLSGATKFSKYLAKLLKENYDLQDERKNRTIKEIYDEKLKLYKEEIEK